MSYSSSSCPATAVSRRPSACVIIPCASARRHPRALMIFSSAFSRSAMSRRPCQTTPSARTRRPTTRKIPLPQAGGARDQVVPVRPRASPKSGPCAARSRCARRAGGLQLRHHRLGDKPAPAGTRSIRGSLGAAARQRDTCITPSRQTRPRSHPPSRRVLRRAPAARRATTIPAGSGAAAATARHPRLPAPGFPRPRPHHRLVTLTHSTCDCTSAKGPAGHRHLGEGALLARRHRRAVEGRCRRRARARIHSCPPPPSLSRCRPSLCAQPPARRVPRANRVSHVVPSGCFGIDELIILTPGATTILDRGQRPVHHAHLPPVRRP